MENMRVKENLHIIKVMIMILFMMGSSKMVYLMVKEKLSTEKVRNMKDNLNKGKKKAMEHINLKMAIYT